MPCFRSKCDRSVGILRHICHFRAGCCINDLFHSSGFQGKLVPAPGSDLKMRDLFPAPADVHHKVAFRYKTAHRAVRQLIRERGQDRYVACMALEQQLRDARCSAEVSVDLERRVQVKEIRSRAVLHQVLKQLVIRMVAVLESCPHVKFLSHGPARCSIAAQFQRCLGSFQQFRRLCCDQISRMERHELGIMAVGVVADLCVCPFIPVVRAFLLPFLDLSALADIDRIESLHRILKLLCELIADPQLFGSIQCIREQQIDQLLVKHRAHCPRTLLGRIRRDHIQLVLIRLCASALKHLEEEIARSLHHRVQFIFQGLFILCILIIVIHILKDKCICRRRKRCVGIDISGKPKRIGAAVYHPGIPGRAEQLLRGQLSRLCQGLNIAVQGFPDLRQICRIRRPVVHLQINIRMVI